MNVLKYIKKLFKIKDKLPLKYNVCDIVWAKRYQTEEEKKKIKMGHQDSLYV